MSGNRSPASQAAATLSHMHALQTLAVAGWQRVGKFAARRISIVA